MTTQLIILPNGRAREINPHGPYVKESLPSHSDSCNCNYCDKLFNDWQAAESSLKEYRITGVKKESGEFVPIEFIDGLKENIGSIATFEINQEEGTATIV